ncbi:hypothetical protein ETAA8_29170 [Anatilimnocola aggregata]|uniref:Uncharacterized protein n=1 Tax=Anatilimnocola aggregata TaxID=2528021 RepID=A0A517YC51_9BACT|nr:hypothetical protein [Anatilimnocola aggregata]QDU27826.1 hypothetical protein ETAA8_29170 [Anatilimnocola aggregata]
MNRLTSCVSVAWLALTISSLAAEPGRKFPVPEAAAQQAAVAQVAEVYKPDYELAKSPAQKIELAKKLLLEATATKDDLVARFVLFRVARDIAAQQGDLTTAFDAIERIDVEYDSNVLPQKMAAAATAAKALNTEKEKREVAALLYPLVDEARMADRYEPAKALAELALNCAKEGRDPELARHLAAKATEIEEAAAEFPTIQAAEKVLLDKPSDPEANAAVGKFACFWKGDWERGVPMLALGNDGLSNAAALLELAERPDPLKVGDAWWKVAEAVEGSRRSRVQTHAAEFYRQALPALSGLTKTRVDRLLASLPATTNYSPTPAGARDRTPSIEGIWRESANVVYSISQTGNRFQGTTIYRHPTAGQIRAVVEGNIALDGKITASLRHVQAPRDWQSQKRSAALSADGKTIQGRAILESGKSEAFEWKLQDTEAAFIGMKRKSLNFSKRVFQIASGGVVIGAVSETQSWKMVGQQLVISWGPGDTETLTLSADQKTARAVVVFKNGKKETTAWQK